MNLYQTLRDAIEKTGCSSQRLQQMQHFCKRLEAVSPPPAFTQALVNSARFRNHFVQVTISSEFVQRQFEKQPATLSPLSLNQQQTRASYGQQLQQAVANANSQASFNRALRVFRNRAMVGIIWRDFSRQQHTLDTTAQLSWLAENCVQAAINFHYPLLVEQYGEPLDSRGQLQAFLVLGMGKLGAGELNLSSDIDLIFAYPKVGQTRGAKGLGNQAFFQRLGKALIYSLDAITADGFVFRVDMRLRPFGQSGALVSHFDALETYYQTQGREWERYAMVKARVIASSLAGSAESASASHTLEQLLKNFTYRKYLDFSVIEALRKLKQMINQEVSRRKRVDDVKLGAGGIREIEFIAQSFQLIRGGRDHQLQDNRLTRVLPLLEELRCLPEGTAGRLIDAYFFLRNTEHAIQGYQDRQSHKLPDDADQQHCIARLMGYAHWPAYYQQLEIHRARVKAEFRQVIAQPDEPVKKAEPAGADWRSVWLQRLEPETCLNLLKHAGHENPSASLRALEDLRVGKNVQLMQPIGRQRLDAFMPCLLSAVTECQSPSETLTRSLTMVHAVARRSAYLLLLIENPGALKQLVSLAQASPWIARQLSERPALLDELLDPRSLYHPPDKNELVAELRRDTRRLDENDLEAQLDALRYFRSAHALRVAACEVSGALPLMKVSDYLTWLAESLLEYVLAVSWRQMTAKHGYPDGDVRSTPNFIVVGYGKLGGIELGHGSDLDLVFIHNASTTGYTDGETRQLKRLDNQTFYMRLGQKMIHMLTTRMASGELYAVDMRLRPSGNSGMLVATLNAFEKYQCENAWTWEHQALIRARVVAGDEHLAQQFNDLRQATLCQRRNLAKLKANVAEMREKMRSHLGSDKADDGSKAFHLKQDRGGIVDIEFMVQYAVLAWAYQVPGLCTYTDNIRILESLAQSGLMSTQEVDDLSSAYIVFRSLGHKLTLQQQAKRIEPAEMSDELAAARKKVAALWQRNFETPSPVGAPRQGGA